MSITRRGFLESVVATSLATGLNAQDRDQGSRPGKRPIIVCSNNGLNYLDDAFLFLKNGGDTLDAAKLLATAVLRRV